MFIPFTTKKGFRFTPRCGWASSVPGAVQGSQTDAKMSEDGTHKGWPKAPKGSQKECNGAQKSQTGPRREPEGWPG